MKKQRTKKATTGEEILADFKREYDAMKPGQVINGSWWSKRIDRAIAKEVRRAKLQWERESAMIQAQNSGAGRRVNAGSGS